MKKDNKCRYTRLQMQLGYRALLSLTRSMRCTKCISRINPVRHSKKFNLPSPLSEEKRQLLGKNYIRFSGAVRRIIGVRTLLEIGLNVSPQRESLISRVQMSSIKKTTSKLWEPEISHIISFGMLDLVIENHNYS